MASLQKPPKGSGRLERRTRGAARRRVKAKAKRLTEAQARDVDRSIRFECYLRDHRACRAFRTPLSFEASDQYAQAENHHIVLKSQGGSDDPSNRVTLSPRAHRMRHDWATLDIDGDANARVTFRMYRWVGTARVLIREWIT